MSDFSLIAKVIIDGDWIESKDQSESGIRLIQTGNIGVGEYIDKGDKAKYISEDTFTRLKCTEVFKGDILISRLPDPIGRACVVPDLTTRSITAVDCTIIRLNENMCNKNYFVYYTCSDVYKTRLSTFFSGTTRTRISRKNLEKTYIPLPPLETQKQIAATLDKVTGLINKRKQQLEKLDELVKSRFIEMFGDFNLSNSHSEWRFISEIGTVVGGATPKTNVERYWDGEYRWITPAELNDDSGYIYNSIRKLTKEGVESCSLQEMPIDTVILSSRAPIGKVAIAGKTFYCNQGFKNIICGKLIHPRYLYTILLLNKDYLNSLGRGATFKEISKSIVENIKIPVPPIDLQTQFATFVESIDKLKLEAKQSLEKLETLKKSLMQEYFG